MAVKKRILKSGKVSYIDTTTRRKVERKVFIKENVNRIKNGQIDYNSLSTKEKQSFNVYKRTTYKGKLLSKEVERILIENSSKSTKPIRKGDEVTELGRFSGVDPRKIVQTYSDGQWIKPQERKTMVDIFSAQTQFAEEFKKGSEILLILPNGKKVYGFDAIEALNVYEGQKIEDLDKLGQNPIFIHQSRLAIKEGGEISYMIDLRETEKEGIIISNQ